MSGRADTGAGAYTGPLQWLFEGFGWNLLRPLSDLGASAIATLLIVGGPETIEHLPAYRAPLLAFPALIMLLIYMRGLYRSRLRALFLDSVVPVAGAVSIAAVGVLGIGLIFDLRSLSQIEWMQTWFLALVFVSVARMVLSVGQRWARSSGRIGRPVMILGAGVVGSQIAQRLEAHREYGLRPVGFLDDDPRSLEEVGDCPVPVIGTVNDVDALVERTGVEHLIVAFSSTTDSRVSPLIQRCQELGIEVSVVPRMFDTINNRINYDSVGGLPLLTLTTISPKGIQFMFKHIMDRLAASLILLVIGPLLVLVALAVKLSSPGPVLFRQRRVGRDGKLFYLYKFRSMRVSPAGMAPAGLAPDRSEVGASAAAGAGLGEPQTFGHDTAPGGVEGDDRRTTVGRVIRRTALDELPQLLNVLRGDMSLVGPRPERPEYVELFRQEVARYGERHRVKSGITGWAQVHGLRGKTSLAERVEWDNYYITHWSIGLDLKILLLTVVALFRGSE